ncbi:MAG: P-II family nitrogen regulator [Chloroflexota bacterium]
MGKTTSAIPRSARTSEIRDGKMFVIPVDNVGRFRTGDEGENAIWVKGDLQ